MTLVNTETGEIVEVTYADVKRSVEQAKSSLEEAAEQIVWQIERQAWTVLGYSDWNEMREAEYGGAAFMVPRQDRPELVVRLRRSGLTQQDIADTAGVSKATVINDLKVNSDFQPTTITNARGQERPTSYQTSPTPRDEEPPSREDSTPADVEDAEPPAPRPADHVDLTEFIQADATVQLTTWRKNFMAAIAKSGALMLYAPTDVAEKADVDLINELERLSSDLNNYVSRVRARRPNRLTAIRGGAQ